MIKLIPLHCIKIITQTHDVKTFIFTFPSLQPVTYLAGQHINFYLVIKGEQWLCCYTLSSSPTNTKQVSITIKRIPKGIVSNYFHDLFAVGETINIQPPSGNFHLPDTIPKKVLLLSAGSGITPMLSMLRFMSVMQSSNKVIFFHSAKSEQDLIAQGAIEQLSQQHGHCQVIYTLTQQDKPSTFGYHGRLNKSMFANIQQINEYDVYVCGPKEFRQKAQEILKQLGIKRENYHYESFGEKAKAIKQQENIKPMPATIKNTTLNLHFSKWNKHHKGNNSESILLQGETAGLILPFSCRAGCCGGCKAKLINGEVKQLTTEGLSKEEQAQGYVLLCRSIPLSDVKIEHE